MATVELKKVSKHFDGKQALTSLDLRVEDREFLVVVGPSGCGKSTLLRVLAGLEPVSEGEVFIDDEGVNALAPQHRNIAMVFQNYALYPHMTVRKNMAFPLRMMGLAKHEIDARVKQTAALLDLSELLDRRPKQLSGGQRQRVAMGRALVREPAVFLMDEPLSNLDAKLRVKIRRDIAALQRRLGVTTLYVTHDQAEAMTLGDRVAVFRDGCLQQLATPSELYQHPANTFVATFIGMPGMNVVPAVLSQQRDNVFSLVIGEQRLSLNDVDSVSRQTLARYADQVAYVGMRPESLSLSDDASCPQALCAKIRSCEFFGHETVAFFDLSYGKVDASVTIPGVDRALSARCAARLGARFSVADNETVRFVVDTKQLCFFDKQGNTLTGTGLARFKE